MIQYNQFFRSFCLRTDGQLKSPPLPKLERFELPVLSMVHFIPQSATNLWPSEDWFMYQKNKKPIRLVNHLDFINPTGGPRLRTGDFVGKQRIFRKNNPRFRVALDIEDMKREERAIVTHNYGLLFDRWKYQRSMLANINRWNNVFNTMFATAGSVVGSGYKQYFELTMPKKLPAPSILQKSEAGWNNRNIPLFNSYQMVMLHHIWMWLGENRHKGMIAKNFDKGVDGVHLILREGDRFTVIDMALLNRWRKPSAQEQKLWQEQYAENPSIARLEKGKYSPMMLQKVFLRLMMNIMQTRIEDVPENLGDEAKDNSKENEKILDSVIAGGNDDSVNVSDVKSATVDDEQTEEEAFAGYSQEDQDLEMENLEKDLQILETIGDISEDEDSIDGLDSGDEVDVFADIAEPGETESDVTAELNQPAKNKDAITFFPEEPLDAFKTACNKAAEEGYVTASEYRRLIEMNETTANLPAPLGQSGTLSSYIKIDKKAVVIDKDDSEIKIPDMGTVTDKSMLSSTLQIMDKRYANELYQKDVAGMVMQLAASGVVIKDYKVEEKEDITGTHYEYAISIKPIEGAASTLRFKLPKIEDDGNFRINGVPYRLRKQRGD